jgi:hypothetical protein
MNQRLAFTLIVLSSLLLRSQLAVAQAPAVDFGKMTPEERNAYFAKIREASEVDWRAMMNHLGLKEPTLPPADKDPNRPAHLVQREGSSNWYDSEGNTHVRSGWGIWSNYEEAKAVSYTLPDPLTLKNGQPVRTVADWWKLRRPEILNDFLTEIYGRKPANTPKVTFEVTETDQKALEGRAVKKTIVGHIDNSRYPQATPRIEITLYTPAKATGRLPLIVQVSGGFERFFPKPDGPTAMDMVLEKGWAFATVNTGAIQADNGMGLKEGIIGLMNEGKLRKPDEWGVLAAWCWGLSRALDYFETDKAIHPKQIGIEGHSRWGKTALLAAALDARWAITYSSCSGAMGASLEKRSWGETIDNVAGAGEYHWMAGNFLRYGGNWAAMPVDAHELMALVAPRPLFVTGGTKDQWSDPHGEFLACVAAGSVYRLLGKKDLGTTEMPAPDVSLISGDLAFRNHEGGHTDLPDWPVFLQFASRYFGRAKDSAKK